MDKLDHLETLLTILPDRANNNILTPVKIAKEMIKRLPDDVWNSQTKFLDIACKSGIFLYEIQKKLMETPSIIKEFPDAKARRQHILKNQLYGIAMDGLTQLISIKVVYGHLTEENNICLLDNYIHKIKNFTSTELKKAIEKEFGQEMKFDAVIGNPPYNDEESRGSVGSGNAIFPTFMQKAMDLSSKYTSLVVPSGWMLQYPTGTKHELIDSLRMSGKFVELHDFKNSQDVFESVSIPNGVCYYLTDNDKKDNLTDFYIHSGSNTELLSKIELYNHDANVIFRDKYAISVVEKVKSLHNDEKRFDKVCAGAKHHFDDADTVMTSTWNNYSPVETAECSIKYFLKHSHKNHKFNCVSHVESGIPNLGYGWVSKEQIPHNPEDYKRHKIIVGQAFTAGSPQVMDIPQYIGDNSVCSQSYVPIFSPNNNKEECLNICSYIKTKLFRYLVSCMKTGQNLGNGVYRLVPVQDFSNQSDIDWSKSIPEIDQQIYKKYNLTDEEIAYIESTIKPME